MSKPAPTFCFADEPQFKGPASRGWVAHSLRCYRAQRGRYTLTRAAAGAYIVKLPGHDVAAIITTR